MAGKKPRIYARTVRRRFAWDFEPKDYLMWFCSSAPWYTCEAFSPTAAYNDWKRNYGDR